MTANAIKKKKNKGNEHAQFNIQYSPILIINIYKIGLLYRVLLSLREHSVPTWIHKQDHTDGQIYACSMSTGNYIITL